nr:hypothetical protein Iba_chr03eCG2770 [Ipomoea batatas]
MIITSSNNAFTGCQDTSRRSHVTALWCICLKLESDIGFGSVLDPNSTLHLLSWFIGKIEVFCWIEAESTAGRKKRSNYRENRARRAGCGGSNAVLVARMKILSRRGGSVLPERAKLPQLPLGRNGHSVVDSSESGNFSINTSFLLYFLGIFRPQAMKIKCTVSCMVGRRSKEGEKESCNGGHEIRVPINWQLRWWRMKIEGFKEKN